MSAVRLLRCARNDKKEFAMTQGEGLAMTPKTLPLRAIAILGIDSSSGAKPEREYLIIISDERRQDSEEDEPHR